MPSWRSAAVAAVVLMGVLVPGVAHAAPPSNDDFDTPTVINALPYVTEQDTTAATKVFDDPYDCTGYVASGSVWFSYTATEDGLLRLKTEGSGQDLVVTTLTGPRHELRHVDWYTNGCSRSRAKPVTFRATAGQTYHFMVTGQNVTGGALKLALDRIAPLANDDFANAQPVTLPFSAPKPDFSLASPQDTEPYASACYSSEGLPSVWYSYTPAQNQSVVVQVKSSSGGGPVISVFEGAALSELELRKCTGTSAYNGKAVGLTGGKTYFFQLAGSAGDDSRSTLELKEAPAFTTNLSYSTTSGGPSVNDTIPFRVYTSNAFDDPVLTEWDFGDGTKLPASEETDQSHRYAKDGVYTATIRSTTSDGRISTDTAEVTVKTHDVGITKFTVPASARAGQQKQITVQVGNTRYLETAAVTLYKHDGEWWREVGVLKLDVPAHPTRKVNFPFSYTFTPEDAATGKVTFKAEVKLEYPVYDANTGDNEVIAIATTVRPVLTAAAVPN